MMPTIRIEDDVFAGLQSLAQPFVDTPNSVIRRLLEERKVLPRQSDDRAADAGSEPSDKGHTANVASRPGELTPQPIYEKFLLHTMAAQFNGSGEKHQVTKAVLNLMQQHGFLGPDDFQDVSSGESRAQNTIAWGRNALKDRGLISRNSRRGTWELTEAGLRAAQAVVLPKKAD